MHITGVLRIETVRMSIQISLYIDAQSTIA